MCLLQFNNTRSYAWLCKYTDAFVVFCCFLFYRKLTESYSRGFEQLDLTIVIFLKLSACLDLLSTLFVFCTFTMLYLVYE